MPPPEMYDSAEDIEEDINNQDIRNLYADMPPLETDKSEEDTDSVHPLYTDDSEDNTEYGENDDSDDPDIWIGNVNGHNEEIENFLQAAFVLSTNNSPDTMEQLDGFPPLSQEGCEGDKKHDGE